MEIWKPLCGFPNYNGSSEGRIINIRTNKILKTYTDEKGYVLVCLRKNNHPHTVKLHRILAITFLGDHPGMDVYHKDLNRSNNHIDNLEWRTRHDTISAAFESGSKHPPRSTKIRVIETGDVYDSVRSCAKVIGCDRSEIFKYLAGARPHVKGYHFERL